MAKIFLVVTWLVLGTTPLFAEEVKGKTVRYGVFERLILKENLNDSFRETWMLTTNNTDRVPARLGIKFGVRFEITNLDPKEKKLLKTMKVVVHPPITGANGKASESETTFLHYPICNRTVEAQSAFTFTHENELVPGLWRIEIKVEGKVSLFQTFTVFEE